MKLNNYTAYGKHGSKMSSAFSLYPISSGSSKKTYEVGFDVLG